MDDDWLYRVRRRLPRKKCDMSRRQGEPHTILHFCSDPAVLKLRGRFLNDRGYRVLNSSDGFEAIKLSTSEQVDAAVLDLDHMGAEVTLIAQEIKRRRPHVPTILLTEATAPVDGVCDLADALVPKENDPESLVKSLEKVLTGHSDAAD